MSTDTLTPPEPGTATTPKGSLLGSARVLLRVHRRSLWAAGGLLVLCLGAVPGLLLWVRSQSSKELCPDGDMTPCGDDVYLTTPARSITESYLAYGGSAVLLLSVLVGAFVAGPLIARELESGTFRMAWAQSVSPARWLAARLAVPAALGVAGISALCLVYRWGWTEIRRTENTYDPSWWQGGVFPGIGPAAVGYLLFGVAVGALCALLIRRMLLSMAVTVVVFGVAVTGFTERRWMLWPTDQVTGGGWMLDRHDWITEWGMRTASGERVLWEHCDLDSGDKVAAVCMADRGGLTMFVDYHPASHLWPLQLVETGILLALAALATCAAFRLLRRLHG
ncbi:ABC transporter permease [Streptomyces cyaneofuscatus]|uniref:ABC transporter permease n=1 Tax=Streptomyces cyaneofuscatus TaxID=66883 RepID=UPI00342D9834